MFNRIFRFTFLAILLALGGCGVGQSGDVPPAPQQEDTSVPPTPSTSVKGNAVDGLILGGTVTIYPLNQDGTFGELLASTLTDENGLFSIDIQTNETNLAFKVTGGRYIDEWTGETVELLEGDFLELWITGFTPGEVTTSMITPLTTLAAANARFFLDLGSKLENAISKSTKEFVKFFQNIQIGTVYPHPWTQEIFPDARLEATHYYGLYLAGISGYAALLSKDYGKKITSIQVIMALVRDIESDGFQDGLKGALQVVYVDEEKEVPLADEALRWGIPLQALYFILSYRNSSPFTLDAVLSFFQDISVSQNLFFNPYVSPIKIEREYVVPVVGSIEGTVYNCSAGEINIYEYVNSGAQGKLFDSISMDENGNFKGEFSNYDGLVYIKAICGQYYEWSTNKYVLTEYPLTSLVEVKKGGDYERRIAI